MTDLAHWHTEHEDNPVAPFKGSAADLERLHAEHHAAMQLDHSHGDTRNDAIEEAESALAGAVAHLETVTQALAEWNAAPELGHGADADLKATHKANYWDAVYRQSEDVLRRLLDLTGAIDTLKGE